MKSLLSISFLVVCSLFFAPLASADTVCQPIYGGGVSCPQVGNIAINKQINNPQTTNVFVENLDVNNPRFSPDQIVRFKITVTNNGNASLSNITVKDIFPEFVLFVAGAGSFDSNTKTLSFNVGSLNAGASQSFDLTAKVVAANQIPSDKNIICVINQAIATVNSQTSQDNVQFCIEKKVEQPIETKGGLKVFPTPAVTVTPPTGPEMLPLLGLLPTGLFGFLLRKKAKIS